MFPGKMHFSLMLVNHLHVLGGLARVKNRDTFLGSVGSPLLIEFQNVFKIRKPFTDNTNFNAKTSEA